MVRSLRAQPLGRDGRLPQTLALAPTLRHPQPLVAPQPLHPLAFDCQFEQTAEDRALKLLNIVDEFTRESLVMLVERSIDADTVVAVLERLVAEPGAPELFRGDNGPGMTAHALRDWCVLSRTATAFIEPGSPWQNPFVESLHSRVCDELPDVEEFSCLIEARVVIGDWREDYNWRTPHSALGMKAPGVFAAEWAATSELAKAA